MDDAEAVALNTLELFEDQTPEAGHAIQLSLAAHTAVGKAKGKGRKGRGQGKGKVVRSHLTLEQRRDPGEPNDVKKTTCAKKITL